MQERCDKAVEKRPMLLEYNSDKCEARKMCERVVEDNVYMLECIIDKYKTKKYVKRGICHPNMSAVGTRPAKRVKELLKIILVY